MQVPLDGALVTSVAKTMVASMIVDTPLHGKVLMRTRSLQKRTRHRKARPRRLRPMPQDIGVKLTPGKLAAHDVDASACSDPIGR